jgi:hypothetical protein|tara:strand:- start:1733 stop:1936 length:204 start_codon:yes stop_codon:yes gene_type:complete
MRDDLLRALKAHAQGHIQKHKANLEVYLSSPVGIGEHPDIIAAMEAELEQLAKWDDNFEMIKKYLDK